MIDQPPGVGVRLLDPRLTGWGFPRWGSAAAAGLDLHACIETELVLEPQAPAVLIPAGIVVTIRDPDWCALVLPRSGLGHREGLVMGNGTGVIDADYEGQILISAWNRNPAPGPGIAVAPGDRIAQLVFTRIGRPLLSIHEDAPEGPGSGRGAGGFGSSGRR
ncbi:dUTP diphosphatase [Methylobacterium sp. sgz302541]|uniref:dUTP diphosphatase n=1 Tax=unclassified Methylobacterium TaxID=2615210 RepID=UPI003D342F00